MQQITDQDSYTKFLDHMQVTEKEIQEIMHSFNDDIHTPDGFDHITVRGSELAGKGIFSDRDINTGEIVCPMRTGTDRTIAGRFTNHAEDPNSFPEFLGGVLSLIANSKILKDTEITVSYYDVINCRKEQGENI